MAPERISVGDNVSPGRVRHGDTDKRDTSKAIDYTYAWHLRPRSVNASSLPATTLEG